MNIKLTDFFVFSLLILGFWGVGYVVRFMLFNIRAINPWSIFYSLFVGVILVVTTFSIIVTHGRTVNILFAIPAILIWYFEKKRTAKSKLFTVSKFDFISFFVLFVITFIWSQWLTYTTHGFGYVVPHGDYVYNSIISAALPLTGQENEFHFYNLYNTDYHGIKPYHFFELWLNSFISQITNEKTVVSQFLFSFPIFYYLIVIGIYCISRFLKNNTYISVVAAVVFLFFSGIDFPELLNLPIEADLSIYARSALNPTLAKLSYYYVFLIAFIMLVFEKKIKVALLVLSSLVIASIVPLPSMLLGFTLLLLLNYAIKKKDFVIQKSSMLYPFIVFFSVILFFLLMGSGGVQREGGNIQETLFNTLSSLTAVKDIITRINIMGGSVVYFVLMFFPVIFLLLFFFRKTLAFIHQHYFWILLFLSIWCSGLVVWAGLFKLLNSSQLFYNIAIPITGLSLFIMLIYVFSNISSLRYKFLVTLIIIIISVIGVNQTVAFPLFSRFNRSREYSPEFIKEVTNRLKTKKDEPQAVLVLREVDFYNNPYAKYLASNQLYILPYSARYIFSFTLDDFKIPIDSTTTYSVTRDLSGITTGLFYRQVMKEKSNGTFISIDSSAQVVLDKLNTEYGLLMGNVELPVYLSGALDTIATDNTTNTTFVKIK